MYVESHKNTRKLCYRKDDRVMCLIYECPESFLDFLTTPMDTFPLAVPEIIAIGLLVRVVNPNLGEEEVVGVADGTIRKSVGDFL